MSSQFPSISIINGRLVDPANHIDEALDLHIAEGKVLAVGKKPEGFEPEKIIDAKNKIVCPGLVDINVRLREPGLEFKATIESETAAAAKAGITTLVCQPDTNPVIDTAAVVELIRRKAKHSGKARVLTLGAMTQSLAGHEISEMSALKAAGCVAISNAGKPLANTLVERRALEYASTFDINVFVKPEDPHLRNKGCVHEGVVAARLGLPGFAQSAETVAIARDIALAEATNARLHFQTISTARGVQKIQQGLNNGISLSADVAAHQLHLTEQAVDGFDSCCHVDPPLRTLLDRDALRQAVADGTISAICSDHQPHDMDAKLHPFPESEAGISSLETLLGLTLKLVQDKIIDLPTAIARLTIGPAEITDLPFGRLDVGRSADICIFDLESHWILNDEEIISEGHNTPFINWEFSGQVTHTLFEGRLVHERKPR